MSNDTSKTTLYLDTVDYRRLKAHAAAEGKTAAMLVREAVAEYLATRTRSVRPSSVAAGRSGRGDVAARAEDLLAGMGGTKRTTSRKR